MQIIDSLPADQKQALQDLLRVFLAENQKINLSAMRTEESCWTGNILDSLSFLELIQNGVFGEPTSIMDIGTGGGFPLLPLAITLPKARCTGLDSTGKKIEAIRRISGALHMTNIELIAGRAENIGHEAPHREKYDVVTARAVAKIPELLEYCSPFVRIGGYVVLWKSLQATEEVESSKRAQKELCCTLIASHTYDLGGEAGQRQLLVFRKEASLSVRYPRAVGEPKTMPIT